MACDTPFFVDNPMNWKQEKVPVPCGRCPECRRKRVNDWVFRMQQEDRRSRSSHFVTLTYDTSTVPISKKGFMTLRKKDFQDFMKRLRKMQPDVKIKYYCVGEYGTENQRPHYHAIMFNVQKTDFINDAWGLGSVHIGGVSGASIGYTTKYIDKPRRIPAHRNDDRLKEFSLMSKKLGDNYLTDAMVAYHRADLSRNYVTLDGGVKSSLPRYYRDKIFSDTEKEVQRKLIQASLDRQYEQTKIEVNRLYGDAVHPDNYLTSQRLGRYKRDQAKQNTRLL